MRNKKQIKKLVEQILREDRTARNSDKYLYVEVIRRLNPNLLYEPFYKAMESAEIPCMETVRRSRQWCQAHFGELAADINVQAFREYEEDDYTEVFVHG